MYEINTAFKSWKIKIIVAKLKYIFQDGYKESFSE